MRGSEGIWIVNGAPSHDPNPLHRCDQGKTCKVMQYSADGRLLAWATADCVYILDVETYSVLHQLQQTRVAELRFSPKGSILATWGPYVTDREGKGGEPNMVIWDVATGMARKTFLHKKQFGWAPEWSADEAVCCRTANSELHFYQNNDFENVANKLHLQKVADFKMAPGSSPCVISAYVPGIKGQPSYVRVYRYPHFDGQSAAVANKSFYKADRVNMYWNKIGTGLVILTSTESSDSSYYGEQALHYISTAGESCLVPLDKKGPVYSVMWSPRNNEFCVVYGYMPSKVTLFNLKCEPVFDFGTGPRNHCFYNPHANILCLAGFGNLAGHMEFWDLKQKKEIAKFKAADTTTFEWSPDGEHVLTATVAPRLRVGNGYRLWHYTGSLLSQVDTPEGEFLWDARWRPVPEGTFREKPVRYKPAEPGLTSVENKKTEAYRPPQARAANYTPSTKLHEYEPASNIRQAQAAPDKPPSKNKKKRDARKAKTTGDGEVSAADEVSAAPTPTPTPSASASAGSTTGDPEKDKKIRNLRKKLQQVEKLKEQQKSGKQLELNQMEKLKTEAALLQELKDLEIG
ncbi:eukaryotic translation initiation factor 2A-like isoform X2 [Babylonia areolata]|uniref:eukaryotic translation initiation factor 2A-like isoform X2 n=1 Tax=Babylonia areolata TaxID=304850 RepID=UPI003FD66F37